MIIIACPNYFFGKLQSWVFRFEVDFVLPPSQEEQEQEEPLSKIYQKEVLY